MLMACMAPGFSQNNYYPGGLGNTNLKLWLTAADPTTILNAAGTQAANNAAIAKWVDKSGNLKSAVQGTAAARPVNKTNQLNGRAGVVFTSATPTQYMTGASTTFQTMVAVRIMLGTPSAAVGGSTNIAHYQTLFASAANTDFSIRGGGNGTSYGDGTPFNANDWPTGTAGPNQWLNGTLSSAGSSTYHILVSAANAPVTHTYSLSTTFKGTDAFARGMYGGDAVYEILGYNNTLNNTQRIILENYEASGWGLTGKLPSSGYSVFTPPTASTYNRNLVGIGKISALDYFLANPSAAANGSTDGLGFSSATGTHDFLYLPGFIMAAHNGQANTTILNANIAGISGSTNIWNRSWYIQKFNGLATGNVTLNFSQLDYDGTSPDGSFSYGILYNATDGTFSSGTNLVVSSISTSVGTNTVTFVVNATNLPTGYYTLVWSEFGPLPILLSRFEATKAGTAGRLDWTLSEELHGDHFDIQRAGGDSAFSTIGTLPVSPGQAGGQQYHFTDEHPLAGINEYRLKLVDMDGRFSYSPVRALSFGQSAPLSLQVYPNPVDGVLQISSASPLGNVSIQITDETGRLVLARQVNMLKWLTLPVSELSRGIYFIRFMTGSASYTQKIIKK